MTFMRKERLKSLDYGMEIKGLVSELHLVFFIFEIFSSDLFNSVRTNYLIN